MKQKVIMLVAFPAAGKSTITRELASEGYVVLNRDVVGGKVVDLLPKMVSLLDDGKSVVLDNTNGTILARQPFVEVCLSKGVPIECFHLDTSIENAQINALHRMYDRYGMIFHTQGDIKAHYLAKDDPNIFPIAVLFAFRKSFENPTTKEGFSAVNKITFTRRALDSEFRNSAVIFDYDETLRTVVGGEYTFPTRPEEVAILPGRIEKVQALANQGTILLGVSNQSGVAKGQVSVEMAEQCFRHTNELLGVSIDVRFCRHGVPPTCYCRKPQAGLGIELVRKYNLDPNKVIFVGDRTTDRTFAEKCGFTYVDQAEYFV